MKNVALAVLLVLSIALTACAATTATPTAAPTSAPTLAPTAALTADQVIVLGDIDSQPTDQIERWQLLADYLGANLKEFGISAGTVQVAPDMETMGSWLVAGEVDLTFESIYPAMLQVTRFGSSPLLRQWKGGDAEYASIIFTRADSGVQTLADLRGQRLAFEQPSSTTAFFLPTVALIDAGLQPVALQQPDDSFPADAVGYLFSESDTNTIQWVISGKVVAGATSNQDYRDIPAETRQQLRVLYETPPVPRQLVLTRAGMAPQLRERIADLLIALGDQPEGARIREAFEETARFDALPAAAQTEIQRFQELQARLEP
ncbi:MAG: phosphate/phosphite/phosphonate ABC transporter substrate-binding protein [Oscillochloris sp.]|nr:phosphate/phosphite/phosphonate ABC transporter substrate-binding protein [Oscillochloris sp.]